MLLVEALSLGQLVSIYLAEPSSRIITVECKSSSRQTRTIHVDFWVAWQNESAVRVSLELPVDWEFVGYFGFGSPFENGRWDITRPLRSILQKLLLCQTGRL